MFILQQWLTIVLGLWVIALPFVGIQSRFFTLALVLSGIAVALIGLWGTMQPSQGAALTGSRGQSSKV